MSQSSWRDTIAALSWIGSRCREAGPIHVIRRAVNAFAEGGPRRLRDHFANAAASSARERRYQRWLTDREPAAIADLASPNPRLIDAGLRFSIIVPFHDTPSWMLDRCIRSVLAQTYPGWELCIVDDASHDARLADTITDLARREPRIRFTRRSTNGGISAASNTALALATGDFVAFLDHDDELSPHALAAIAKHIAVHPDTDLLYSDEDKIDSSGRRHAPTFKPGFSPHYLYTCNYICHFLVIRRDLLTRIGKLRSEFDGAQDYDLILRALAVTLPTRIRHIPIILYHWRTHAGSTSGLGRSAKPYAVEAGRRALADHFNQLNIPARVEHGPFRLTYRVRPEIDPHADRVKLSINGATRLADNESHPTFVKNLAIDPLIAPSNSDARLLTPFILEFDPALSPTSRLPDDWLDRLIEAAKLPFASDIGCAFIDSDTNRIDNAGFLLHSRENRLTPVYRGARSTDPGYLWSLLMPRNVSAVDPACILRRCHGTNDHESADNTFTQILPEIAWRRAISPADHASLDFLHPEDDHLLNPQLEFIEPAFAPLIPCPTLSDHQPAPSPLAALPSS